MKDCHKCTTHAHQDDATIRPAYMLPMDVMPLDLPDLPGYQITLAPEIYGDNPHFEGSVAISILVNTPVKEFPINSVDLHLQMVRVTDSTGNPRKPILREDPENERVWLCFDEELATGKGEIFIKYRGKFNPQLQGFYLSEYQNEQGETETIASTQSQPADFRRWVPSFDQPGPTGYKSRFQFTVVVDADLTVRSNAEITEVKGVPSTNDEVKRCGGKKKVCFAPTNMLPTYVAALAIGKLESSDPIMVSGVEVRIWGTPGKKHLMDFALEVLERGLPLLENFHGAKYPNKKLDLIAVPNFPFGAMENDGMFIFREELLLVDKARATVAQFARVAEVVLHEADHTWDGNKITMMDWSQLSLNELRATFMAQLIADMIYPEWDTWTRFAQSRAQAMLVDGLENTRPIVSVINHVNECPSIVDAITYLKGSAVMRQGQMFLDMTIPGGFERGVQHFNTLYEWGNASTEQLWDAIGEKTGFDFTAFMDTWMLQPGFPTVTVTRNGASKITVSQSPFKYLHEAGDADQLWQIPLFIRTYTNKSDDCMIPEISYTVKEHVLLLTEREQTFDLGDFNWLVVNAGGHGFYRVQYDNELLSKVLSHLQTDLSAVERFNVLNDAWALLQAGSMNVSSYLGLVKKYENEHDPNVWKLISSSLIKLGQIAPVSAQCAFKEFVFDVALKRFQELGWEAHEDDTPQISELRGTIIGLLGYQKFDEIINQTEMYAYFPWLNNEAVDADVLNAAVRVLALNGGKVTYAKFVGHLKKNDLTPQQERMFLEALCCFPDSKSAAKTLDMIDSGEIKAQMGGILINWLMQQTDAVRDYTWQFVKDEFEELKGKFPTGLFIRALEGARFLDKPENSADVADFFAANAALLKGSEKPVAQTLEWQRINTAFRRRCAEGLRLVFWSATTH